MASMVRDSNLQQEEEGGTRWEGAQDVEFSRSRTNAPFKTQNTDTQTHTGIQTHIKTHTGTHAVNPSTQESNKRDGVVLAAKHREFERRVRGRVRALPAIRHKRRHRVCNAPLQRNHAWVRAPVNQQQPVFSGP